MPSPLELLRQYWGYDQFRPPQQEVIESILTGRDVLVVLPTGGGKSLCFQIPALVMGGTTVVVSPLIALMQDQVEQLRKRGVPATYINSSLRPAARAHRLRLLAQGHYRLVYLAPEALRNQRLKAAMRPLFIPLLAVDEVHCISEWGHDFRPSYRMIAGFVDELSQRPVVSQKSEAHRQPAVRQRPSQPQWPVVAAFTATATLTTRQDVITSLRLRNPRVILLPARRTNLYLGVWDCPDDHWQALTLVQLIQRHGHQPGIIYTTTRAAAEHLDRLLSQWQFALPSRLDWAVYHGGLDAQRRAAVQREFIGGELKLIIATNAFGMGVDKADIRYIVHYQLPLTLEGYYQEAGRAGRDGGQSWCYLLFNPADITICRYLALSGRQSDSTSDLRVREVKGAQLEVMIGYAVTEACRHRYLERYFGLPSEEDKARHRHDKEERSRDHETSSSQLEPSKNCGRCGQCQPLSTTPHSWRRRLEQLTKWRANQVRKSAVHPLNVATDRVLTAAAVLRPSTFTEWSTLPGVGTGWLRRHWQRQPARPADRR